MKLTKFKANPLNLDSKPGLHQKWHPDVIFSLLKFLPFGKAMKTPSPALSRLCGRRLQLQPWVPWSWDLHGFCNIGV